MMEEKKKMSKYDAVLVLKCLKNLLENDMRTMMDTDVLDALDIGTECIGECIEREESAAKMECAEVTYGRPVVKVKVIDLRDSYRALMARNLFTKREKQRVKIRSKRK